MPLPELVDGPGRELFAGAALAQDNHRGVRLGGVFDKTEHLLHGDGSTDQPLKGIFRPQVPTDSGDLFVFFHDLA